MRTAVIGAGASGLSLALLLDGDVVVYEATDRPAGHSASTVRQGFTFDRGPHIMFSRNAEVLSFMVDSLRGNVHRSKRNNRVALGGRLAKYPIENDLAGLPDELRNRLLLDFLFNEHAGLAEHPSNLAEWFLGVFGAGMTDSYFRPYNEKVWNVPLEELSMTWSERIPQPPPQDVVKGALGISTEGYLHQLFFHYPERGGYEAIPAAWAELLPAGTVRLSTAVLGLRRADDGVDVISASGTERFDRVVCTAPMPVLVDLVGGAPEAVQGAIGSLQVNPIVAVTLGFEGVDEEQYTAAYFPEPEFLVNRASWPAVFSPENAPPGHFSIQAEITAAPGDPVLGRSDADLTAHVIDGLVARGLIGASDEPVLTDVQRYEQGYVVYTVGYEEHVEVVRDWAESQGVFIHGRFGAFEYLNVDGCVLRSLDMATRLNGRPTTLDEITLEPADAAP